MKTGCGSMRIFSNDDRTENLASRTSLFILRVGSAAILADIWIVSGPPGATATSPARMYRLALASLLLSQTGRRQRINTVSSAI
jgi:hypothetical protein